LNKLKLYHHVWVNGIINKMRIGIDIKAFKNGSTGIARYVRSILDEFQRSDNDNEYVLFACRKSDYSIINRRWKVIISNWRLPGFLWQQFVLPFLLQKNGIDVLWAPEQSCPVFLSKKIKVVMTVHDLSAVHFPQTMQFTVFLIQKYLTLFFLKRSSAVIVLSDTIRKDLVMLYPLKGLSKKITLIYNGKPEWKIPEHYKAESRKEFLFFAGNQEPRKNLINLVHALEILHQSGLNIKLHLAGPVGWKNKNLKKTIENSPVKSSIVSLGYLTDSQLQEQYLTCKALVYPSLYEGFGLPLLEAFQLDCLVLTSKGTVMEEVAGPCAMFFDPTKPESIASAIFKIFQPGFDREKFLMLKHKVLEKYSWQTAASQITQVILYN
jgi:glycosyltransferase involved in cell wall biosynthesis